MILVTNVPCNRFMLVMGVIILAVGSAQAVSNGQTDDFEDGTTQGWMIGAGSQPFNVPTGGPAGVDDNYLQYNSDGDSTNGKLVCFNNFQWSGDYLAAGVTAITMDVFNPSTFQPLSLRLAFGDSASANFGNWYASSDSIDIAPGTDWTSVTFSITASDLTSVLGAGSYANVLSSVSSVRILSSAAPSNKGDAIIGMLAMDNITATPEPAAAVLMLATLLLIRRR